MSLYALYAKEQAERFCLIYFPVFLPKLVVNFCSACPCEKVMQNMTSF